MRDRQALGRRLVGIALFFVALTASGFAGMPPAGLPEIALGWPLLLHVERAAAAVGILGFAILVIWRAGRGEFPFRFANIEYETKVADEMKYALTGHEQRISHVERILGLSSDGVDPRANGG